MAVLLYDRSVAGNFEVLSAPGFILLAITLVFDGIGVPLVGRDSCCSAHKDLFSHNREDFSI
jgi:hypothetical protein